MVALPQELIDTIVDEVAISGSSADSPASPSLKACSLAARIFVAPSQRHLFRSFTLTDATVVQVSRRLTDSPRLASYIREFTMDLWFKTDYNGGLVSLFPLLTGVERLAISHPAIDWQWDRLHSDFRAALVSLFSVPTIRCVTLDGCGGVPSFIIRHILLSCKEVSLSDVYLWSEHELSQSADDPVRQSLPSTAPLDSLILSSRSEKSPTLHSLVLGDEVAHRVNHLRHLELHAPISGSLQGLDMIALKFSRSIQHLAPAIKVVPVLSALARLPRCMPHIETITVVLGAHIPIRLASPQTLEVDKALQKLPRLRQVHFSLPPPPSYEFPLHSKNWLHAQFPMTNGAGLLTISERDAHPKQCPMTRKPIR
ncbi:hypothetical protein FB451DRAFT_1241756 [Mycena latifolia]|nr:hypothetical protein FB451DRAFT_1241756 [Mycena latifolia]